MDDDARRKKGVFGGPSKKRGGSNKDEHRERSRRELKTYVLLPPDYIIDGKILFEEYVEKEVKFAGIIGKIPAALDSTNRTEILRLIDTGKKSKVTPWHLTSEHDAIFSLSVNNIKISKRDGAEELIVRIPIFEVLTICYIQDHAQHLLAIKYGNPDESLVFCNLAVLYCANRSSSEELCSLVGQCFQLVYQEEALNELERAIRQSGNNGLSNDFQDFTSPPYFVTPSVTDPHESPGGSDAPTQSERYLNMLKNELNGDELQQFAKLIHGMNAELPFNEFCEQVLKLYGAKRKKLLVGLRTFIQPSQEQEFELFLVKNGIDEPGNGYMSLSSSDSRKYIGIYRRTMSETSSLGNNTIYGDLDSLGHEAIDQLIADLSQRDTRVSIDTNPKNYIPS